MSESIFAERDGWFTPTEHASGPWDPRALHGGAPAALMTRAFERMEPGSDLRIARLGFEFLRPIPFAPLLLSTRIVRPGRRVQELAGELSTASDGGSPGEVVCRASALRVREVPADLPRHDAPSPRYAGGEDYGTRMAPPQDAEPLDFALDDSKRAGFGFTAMEMRALGDVRRLGPGRVWMRLRHPLLPGEPPTALMRLAATADFGNGVSAVLPFDRFLFINADLTIHLHRPALGEWIGLDARTVLHGGGTGLSESVLHDLQGPVGRAFQTLVVQPR
ncbi:MAG TPA: thioesterase family protein [Solirubrobacteraceae bacterium]|nr:thioesterase family protein [Solirubrobacteraceae bacterium]